MAADLPSASTEHVHTIVKIHPWLMTLLNKTAVNSIVTRKANHQTRTNTNQACNKESLMSTTTISEIDGRLPHKVSLDEEPTCHEATHARSSAESVNQMLPRKISHSPMQ